MRKADVIGYFGGVTQTAIAVGVTPEAVSQWGDKIPQGRAYQIESITNGALKVNAEAEVQHD